MNALLLIPKKYSIANMLKRGFKDNGWTAKSIDFRDIVNNRRNFFYDKTAGLPNKINKKWKENYIRKINKEYITIFKKENPDIVFIYNNQFILPETLRLMKKKSKIVFFLGDNPLFTDTFKFNLDILKYSNYTICPDSYWKEQLSRIGIENIIIDYIGYDDEIFFSTVDIPIKIRNKYNSDALFIGEPHKGASAFKRASFYNSINIENFKLFGQKGWFGILNTFPLLKTKFNLLEKRVSDIELNYAMNCTKIFPIEQNRSIINGIHLRVFESIGAGTLPIVEWRKDLDTLFGKLIPTVKNYDELNHKIIYFIQNESERKNTITQLRHIIKTNYNPQKLVERIILFDK